MASQVPSAVASRQGLVSNRGPQTEPGFFADVLSARRGVAPPIAANFSGAQPGLAEILRKRRGIGFGQNSDIAMLFQELLGGGGDDLFRFFERLSKDGGSGGGRDGGGGGGGGGGNWNNPGRWWGNPVQQGLIGGGDVG